MDENMVIPVYILSPDNTNEKVRKVAILFEDNVFDVNPTTIKVPAHVTQNKKSKKEERDAYVSYLYKMCLNHARNNYKDRPVIIAKESSISTGNPDRIANSVLAATNNGDWDVCYLNKWGDKCHLHDKKLHIQGTMTTLAKTESANGLQAIMFKPKARDEMLNSASDCFEEHLKKCISSKKLNAVCMVPNLIDYDINDAKENSDYARTQECVIPNDNNENDNDQNSLSSTIKKDIVKVEKKLAENPTSSFWIWILILILVLLVVGFIYYYKKGRI